MFVFARIASVGASSCVRGTITLAAVVAVTEPLELPTPIALTVSAYPTSSDVGTYDADVAPEISVSPRYQRYVAVPPFGATVAVTVSPTLGASVESVTDEIGVAFGLLLNASQYAESP